jgi:hypothetical protein
MMGTTRCNLADALVVENPVVLQGAYGDELEPVALNPTRWSLHQQPSCFGHWQAVGVDVVGVVGGGAATPLSVRLTLAGGTVGYARHKIRVLMGLVGYVRTAPNGSCSDRRMVRGYKR